MGKQMTSTTLRKVSIIILTILSLFTNLNNCLDSEECFCGISTSNSQVDEDLNNGDIQTAKIVNFIDQTVSKFNSLHLQSDKAELPFKFANDSHDSLTLMDVRLSSLKAIL